ncbi:hypothetical protein BU16DRAFT_587216 [Lophium mytilinum]|uniref:Uncharacterized protein n=1 Tax=Lophium mytilinum TaxID=390894 RepID=A0A6A6RF37_9PEZI|nr:hypothetical protein BU16DRAFT_587216 [Lophium mytilinum]
MNHRSSQQTLRSTRTDSEQVVVETHQHNSLQSHTNQHTHFTNHQPTRASSSANHHQAAMCIRPSAPLLDPVAFIDAQRQYGSWSSPKREKGDHANLPQAPRPTPPLTPRPRPILGVVRKARLCGHFLHPASPSGTQVCPVCVARRLVPELCQKLRRLPPPYAANEAKLARWELLRKSRAWVANYENSCGHHVEKERAWEVEHPEVDVSACKTAAMAVEDLWKAIESLYDQEGKVLHPAAASTSPTKKKVSFTLPEGEEKQTRQENGLFCRVHPIYKPGKYAAPEGSDGWENTSWMRDESYNSPRYQEQFRSDDEGPAKEGHLARSLSKAKDVFRSLGSPPATPPSTPPKVPPKTPERTPSSVLRRGAEKNGSVEAASNDRTPAPRKTLYRIPTIGELNKVRTAQPGLINRSTFINTFSATNQPHWTRESAGAPPEPAIPARSSSKLPKSSKAASPPAKLAIPARSSSKGPKYSEVLKGEHPPKSSVS